MLKLCGTYVGTDSETIEPKNGGESFVKHTVRVRNNEGRTYYVQASKDFGRDALPAEGQPVELLVWPRPYVQKSKDTLGCGFTAYAVAPALQHV